MHNCHHFKLKLTDKCVTPQELYGGNFCLFTFEGTPMASTELDLVATLFICGTEEVFCVLRLHPPLTPQWGA